MDTSFLSVRATLVVKIEVSYVAIKKVYAHLVLKKLNLNLWKQKKDLVEVGKGLIKPTVLSAEPIEVLRTIKER
jgi:hypothetical protein